MAKTGDHVRVDFIGTLDDGSEFSNSYLVGEPFEFVIGDGNMLPAFEDAVRTLEVGEETSVRIPCEKAYGHYDESLVEQVPAHLVPKAHKLPFGGYIELPTPEGDMRVKVLKVENGVLFFDHNHELADQDLNFYIKLVEIVE